ncbi:MAG: molybdopterin dehydrogenase FAD-binding [Anaerocolumna sp.]|jgi:CO/xanthine dehydrogenase FAD-binding subunit|nr:molybdopterin dehydrogenase FAD-binding [Anaerocolumna sp.]
MLTISQYVKAESIQQAYELNQKRSNVVLGGMHWLKLQKRNVGTAIDLSDLGLDTIEETKDSFIIGAMVTLRQLEQHKELNDFSNKALTESVRQIVGIQFRNMATVGGSIFGRYGFSDVLTVFLAMDAQVELYNKGILSLEEFTKLPYDRDLLIRLIIKKEKRKTVYLSQRNTKTDFPVLTCSVSETNGNYRFVIGARPKRAVCFYDRNGILDKEITEASASELGNYISSQVETGSNMRGSEEYRRILAGVLTKRALLQMKDM